MNPFPRPGRSLQGRDREWQRPRWPLKENLRQALEARKDKSAWLVL